MKQKIVREENAEKKLFGFLIHLVQMCRQKV